MYIFFSQRPILQGLTSDNQPPSSESRFTPRGYKKLIGTCYQVQFLLLGSSCFFSPLLNTIFFPKCEVFGNRAPSLLSTSSQSLEYNKRKILICYVFFHSHLQLPKRQTRQVSQKSVLYNVVGIDIQRLTLYRLLKDQPRSPQGS